VNTDMEISKLDIGIPWQEERTITNKCFRQRCNLFSDLIWPGDYFNRNLDLLVLRHMSLTKFISIFVLCTILKFLYHWGWPTLA